MAIFDCPKHGTVHDKGIPGRCPICAGDEHVTVHISGKSVCTPADQRKAEEAVLRAAVGWAHARGNSSPGNAGSHGEKSTEAWARELFSAVDAYVDPPAQKPKPVKPEEVEPGVWFRFAKDCRRSGDTGATYQVIRRMGDDDNPIGFMSHGSCAVYIFRAEDLIIPLTEEDQ